MEVYNPVDPAPIPIDQEAIPPAPQTPEAQPANLAGSSTLPPSEPIIDQSVGQKVDIQA